MSQCFEDRVTLGVAQWITQIETDDAAETLRIDVTHNPESPATERSIDFAQVEKLISEWEDRDDERMESIIGAHEERDGEQFRYMFHTDQRELWIWTRQRAAIR